MYDLYKTPRLVRQVLLVVFLLAVLGAQVVSAQTALPPCTMSLISELPNDNDGIEQDVDIDKDGDGLIEICDLEGLYEMRYVPDGSGYTTSTTAGINRTGCSSTCTGFELTRNLDFSDDGSYRTPANRVIYTVNNADDTGWEPIGTSSNPFNARFEGNEHTISNLRINRSMDNIGLFGVTDTATDIADIGLLNVRIIGGTSVGGLVGDNSGSITQSYATGSVRGTNLVGGLVGDNFHSIAQSYAMGSVEGTNQAGGLSGRNTLASIMNSYAASSVSGNFDVGGLVGFNNGGSITNSYAAGFVSGTNSVGHLVGLHRGSITNSYATGLDDLVGSSSGSPTITNSSTQTLVQLRTPTTATEIYSDWSTAVWDFGTQNDLPTLKNVPEVVSAQVLPPCTMSLISELPDDNDGVPQVMDVDKDGDGLIEICDLEGLYEMRYVLDGSGYSTSPTDIPNYTGCPSICTGFELTKTLNFTSGNSYRTPANKVIYTSGNGWEPIGNTENENSFNTRFEGNGHTIFNLRINRRNMGDIGLFSFAGARANITNIGLLNVRIIGGDRVGGLVGRNNGSIMQSYATGSVQGINNVGGLVGVNSSSITNSYAARFVSGNSNIGGLVGFNSGSITNSYATGSVSGFIRLGGLVGNHRGSITNSYATGSVSGRGIKGGLVGFNMGPITNSYATGFDMLVGVNPQTATESSTQTVMALETPTSATGIYKNWDPDVWDFGTQNDLPTLRNAPEIELIRIRARVFLEGPLQ